MTNIRFFVYIFINVLSGSYLRLLMFSHRFLMTSLSFFALLFWLLMRIKELLKFQQVKAKATCLVYEHCEQIQKSLSIRVTFLAIYPDGVATMTLTRTKTLQLCWCEFHESHHHPHPELIHRLND
jgi:hypothetical protein